MKKTEKFFGRAVVALFASALCFGFASCNFGDSDNNPDSPTDTPSQKEYGVVKEVKVNKSGYLEGASSFLTMERGRGPGNVPRNFTSIIRDWIIAKGISYQNLIPKNGTPEQGLTRLSGAIAYSIMKNGTKLYRDKGYNDIFDTVLKDELEKIATESAGVFDMEIDKIHQDNENT